MAFEARMINLKRKFSLFRQSKNFCSCPWNVLYVWTNGDIKTCNKGSNTLGNVLTQDIHGVLTNAEFKKIKSEILSDRIPDNCQYCRRFENSGNGVDEYSHLRNMYNTMFVDQDVDYDAIDNFGLGAVDLHWSSICDLKCITCWPMQSSSIAKEQNLPVQHVNTQKALDMIDFIVDNQKTLKEVYLSGGEPTLIKYNLNLLQKLDKRNDLTVRVNSNLMWSHDNSIVQEILKFPKVLFTCSADNTKEKFEYIRRGASWSTFVDNLRYLAQFSNVELRVNSVFFVLSAIDLSDTVDYFYQHHLIKNFTINQCSMGHTYLRCRNLPVELKQIAKQRINLMKEKYKSDLNLVGCLNNCQTELELNDSECYRSYLASIDSIAGTDWQRTFPEIS